MTKVLQLVAFSQASEKEVVRKDEDSNSLIVNAAELVVASPEPF